MACQKSWSDGGWGEHWFGLLLDGMGNWSCYIVSMFRTFRLRICVLPDFIVVQNEYGWSGAGVGVGMLTLNWSQKSSLVCWLKFQLFKVPKLEISKFQFFKASKFRGPKVSCFQNVKVSNSNVSKMRGTHISNILEISSSSISKTSILRNVFWIPQSSFVSPKLTRPTLFWAHSVPQEGGRVQGGSQNVEGGPLVENKKVGRMYLTWK